MVHPTFVQGAKPHRPPIHFSRRNLRRRVELNMEMSHSLVPHAVCWKSDPALIWTMVSHQHHHLFQLHRHLLHAAVPWQKTLVAFLCGSGATSSPALPSSSWRAVPRICSTLITTWVPNLLDRCSEPTSVTAILSGYVADQVLSSVPASSVTVSTTTPRDWQTPNRKSSAWKPRSCRRTEARRLEPRLGRGLPRNRQSTRVHSEPALSLSATRKVSLQEAIDFRQHRSRPKPIAP